MFITLVSLGVLAQITGHKPHAVAPYKPTYTVAATSAGAPSGQIPLAVLDTMFSTSTYTKRTTYTMSEYGGYVYVSPTLEVRHYGYSYGAGKRMIVMNDTPDGTTGRTVLSYVPDTSGATPNTAIRRDFAPAIHRYKLHVTDGGTTLAKTFNTSGGFQQFAGTSVGATP